MARKMRSVILAEAWLEFWPVLFPDSPDWKTTLEGWVRANLLHFDAVEFFPSEPDLVVSRPWASSLFIDAERRGARVSIGDRPLEFSPWFAATLVEYSPQWKDQHPIERLVGLDTPTSATESYWVRGSSKMVRNVTLRAGNYVRSGLMKALREGRLTATGTCSIEGFRERRSISTEQLKAMAGLELMNNRIAFQTGVPHIVDVQVARNPNFKDNKRRGGSFAAADAELVEEMHRLINAGQASSVVEAARAVLPRAQRRGNADDDSVIYRLRKLYGRNYPTRRRK